MENPFIKRLLQAALVFGVIGGTVLLMNVAGFFEFYAPNSETINPSQTRIGAPAGGTAPARVETARPSRAEESIDIARDRHFYVTAFVNDERITFLIDTGATLVFLTPKDAEILGFDFWDDEYSMAIRTASGESRAAPVMLDKIEIGDRITVFDVPAVVSREESAISLLGMSFLIKLDGFEVNGDELILKQ